MIRLILKTLLVNFIGIYSAGLILTGILVYEGGLKTLLVAAIVISVVNLLVRPLVNLLLLPVHLLTLGLFRWCANIITFYIVTLLISEIQINPFLSNPVHLPFLIIPGLSFSPFTSFLFVSLVVTAIFHFLYWIFQD